MKHQAKTLLVATFALIAGALATAEPAAAQRRSGSGWEVTAGKETRSGGASIRVNESGVSLDLHTHDGFAQRGRRARVPRGYDGGRYETRCEQVWVPGYDRQVWVPPVYDWHYDSCGRRHRVLVCAGHYKTVCVPGRYETRTTRVWVPAQRIRVRDNRRGRDSRRYDGRSRAHQVTHRVGTVVGGRR